MKRKFDELLYSSLSNDSRELEPIDHSFQQDVEGTPSSVSRVTVLGDISLSASARTVLELGPSFAPFRPLTPTVSRIIVGSLQSLQDKPRYQAKAASDGRMHADINTNLPLPPSSQLFHRQQDEHIGVESKFRC